MRRYLLTTGILFALITTAHVYLAVSRGHIHHTEIVLIVVSAGLSIWAWRLWRNAAA